MEKFEYHSTTESYVSELRDADRMFRISVPLDFIMDELQGDPSNEVQLAWIDANVANIFGAATARMSGGFVKEPWGRVLVEEITDAN